MESQTNGQWSRCFFTFRPFSLLPIFVVALNNTLITFRLLPLWWTLTFVGNMGRWANSFMKAKICQWLYVAYMYFGCIRFSMSVPPHPFVFTGCGSAGWQGRWKTGHCSSLSTLCPLSSAPQYSLSDLHTLPLCANVQWTDFVRSQYSSKSMLLAEVKKIT